MTLKAGYEVGKFSRQFSAFSRRRMNTMMYEFSILFWFKVAQFDAALSIAGGLRSWAMPGYSTGENFLTFNYFQVWNGLNWYNLAIVFSDSNTISMSFLLYRINYRHPFWIEYNWKLENFHQSKKQCQNWCQIGLFRTKDTC